ncbi:MAG TPA: Gfo/Idh/MocA family oxidoreductase [Herpetosiphonaceae bacterium]|nr:Gfo/Idh/MocA family oxidoreductase [Herpetosiphonaceae bacterium]
MNDNPSMDPVRLGIIGCGAIGRTHARLAAESPLLMPIALADLRLPIAQEVAAQVNVQKVYTSPHQLLADPDVEAVVLALPTAGRADLACQALHAGKHVLVEKPIAMNTAEVRQMIAARGGQVAACCSSRMRGFASAGVATEFLASGVLGTLRVVRCRALKAAGTPPQAPPPAWRLSRSLNGGGILVNWGCYDLDYLLGITGWSLRPRLVLARMWSLPKQFSAYAAHESDAETHVAALITCDDGVVISLERGEFVAAATDEAWQVIGDGGSLRLQMTPGRDKCMVYDEGTPRGVVSRPIWQGNEAEGMDHVAVLEDFARAVRTGARPRTTLDQALLVQAITDAVYASAARGTAVEVETCA